MALKITSDLRGHAPNKTPVRKRIVPEKIISHEIREIGGKPVLVYRSESGAEMYFLAQGIRSMFEDAMRRLNAYAGQHGVAAGQWTPASIVTPSSWNTGLSDTGAVVIVVDRGAPVEQTLALNPEHARVLGAKLIETACRATKTPTKN